MRKTEHLVLVKTALLEITTPKNINKCCTFIDEIILLLEYIKNKKGAMDNYSHNYYFLLIIELAE